MTQEDKELLLKDLCGRLPYKVICNVKYILNNETTYGEDIEKECTDVVKRINFDNHTVYTEWLRDESDIEDIKPYLRPMSSMTDEELIEFLGIKGRNLNLEELKTFREKEFAIVSTLSSYSKHIDWLNTHYFDYRGLIPMGLAIEVTKENNPYKNRSNESTY